MGFNTREVLREVCAFCGKGSECPPVKRSVGPTLPYNGLHLIGLHLHPNDTVGMVAEEIRSVWSEVGFLRQYH